MNIQDTQTILNNVFDCCLELHPDSDIISVDFNKWHQPSMHVADLQVAAPGHGWKTENHQEHSIKRFAEIHSVKVFDLILKEKK